MRWWDPLLPGTVAAGAGERVTADVPDRGPVSAVLYRARHDGWAALWQPSVVWELAPVSPDPGADGMAALLAALRERVRRERPGPDSACGVTWPSRDLAAATALVAHGFAPYAVLAVREARRADDAHDDAPVRVRPVSGVAAAPELTALWLAEREYALAVGAAIAREGAEGLLAREVRRVLAEGEPVWLAEADGLAVGMALCRPPAPRPRLPDGAWLHVETMSVRPGHRGRGVGRALAAAVHTAAVDGRARGTSVFYSPHNALSSVFWHRQGYRPLWTFWEARPATAAR
ncbi:GNAT family N-acetyltransferase [Saccharomonospora piscinae]|uniref:GNAT family N-acetyltransferase n=1 Tax=Saccharomonospora piscinae TaxID=687388 RepID=A0A1V9A4H7_SACPI|nr:GNAT family N-acetyltransferase [Saccharomonospora piscinae]OQO91950.1 GNAT family N-acetyltransferase [Saccharomonospora piscinae]